MLNSLCPYLACLELLFVPYGISRSVPSTCRLPMGLAYQVASSFRVDHISQLCWVPSTGQAEQHRQHEGHCTSLTPASTLYSLQTMYDLLSCCMQGESRAAKRTRVKGAPRRAVRKSQGMVVALLLYASSQSGP